MIKLFEYIFFRVYIKYENWGESNPQLYAECFISFLQGLILLDIIIILEILNIVLLAEIYAKIILGVGSLLFFYYNKKYFTKNKKRIFSQYNNNLYSTRSKLIILTVIIIIIGIPLSIGLMKTKF